MLAHPGEIVDGVVERRVAELAKLLPVLRIENEGTLRCVAAAITAWVISGSLVAVLGCTISRARHAAKRRDGRCARLGSDSRYVLDLVASLLEASRASSLAVVAKLDAAIRDVEPHVDSVLIFVPAGGELACMYASGERAEHFRRLQFCRDDVRYLPAKAAGLGCRAALPPEGGAVIPTDRYALAVPLVDARGLRAVAYASSAGEGFAPAAIDAIVRVAELATAPYAIAVEREADRADATHDGLTGLLAPRAFRRLLHDELARFGSGQAAMLSLWFVDTDHFKGVNDRFGHHAGDAVLQAMASLLRAHLVADVDVAARNGGDEFCALIRGATKSAAIDRARAFCDAVRAHDFGLPIRITASVGVATYPHDAANSSELLEAADAAMYRSKRSGRNRVSFAESPAQWNSQSGASCVERSLQRSFSS